MANRIQLRRSLTTAGWINSTVILAQGEPGVALDTGEIRVGTGTQLWKDLPTQEFSTDLIDNHLGGDASGLVTKVADLEANGVPSSGGSGILLDTDGVPYIASFGGTGTGTGGYANTVTIFGTVSSPRVNPVGGGALPAGACVLWRVNGTVRPTNFLEGFDTWITEGA
jgi:hypothetical protein